MNGPLARRASAISLLVVSFALAALVIRFQPYVEHEIRALGITAYPLAIAVFAIVASAPFSVTDALAIMNGAIFGPVKGSIVNAIGLVFAAMLGYWINRHASSLLELDTYLERLPAWVKRFPIGSPAFLLSVRIIPGFGGTVATATAAAFKVPLWVHVWTMCAIAIPICTLLAIFCDRVTTFVHGYEHRAHVYWEHHHPHFEFHRRPAEATPTP
ncbi:MAG: VTT domain-containing protein [Vulcanimicrobiaceae bacterium]